MRVDSSEELTQHDRKKITEGTEEARVTIINKFVTKMPANGLTSNKTFVTYTNKQSHNPEVILENNNVSLSSVSNFPCF